jgi:hypothetical protein
VVVIAGVGAADDLGFIVSGCGRRGKGGQNHHCHVFIVDTVVVDWWLEEMGVVF